MAEAFIPYGASPRPPKLNNRDEMNARIRASTGPGKSMDQAIQRSGQMGMEMAQHAGATIAAEEQASAATDAGWMSQLESNEERKRMLTTQSQLQGNQIEIAKKEGDLHETNRLIIEKNTTDNKLSQAQKRIDTIQKMEFYKNMQKTINAPPPKPWQQQMWDTVGGYPGGWDGSAGPERKQTDFIQSEEQRQFNEAKQGKRRVERSGGEVYSLVSSSPLILGDGPGPRAPVQTKNGMRASKDHKGQDFKAAVGTEILAPGDGTVLKAEWSRHNGNYVQMMIDGSVVTYLHLKDLPMVNRGQKIKQGEIVGLLGDTGSSTGPHLHVEIREGNTNKYHNVLEWLKSRGGPLGQK